MVDIQSKEVIDKIAEDLKVQPALQIPRELAKAIQLVYNVNPERMIRIKGNTASDATSAAIHTTSATKDTFLVGLSLTIAKSALATSLSSGIIITPFGEASATVELIRYEPTTAGQFHTNIQFIKPIKLNRGSTVTVTNTTATASIDTTGTIFFFEVDPL